MDKNHFFLITKWGPKYEERERKEREKERRERERDKERRARGNVCVCVFEFCIVLIIVMFIAKLILVDDYVNVKFWLKLAFSFIIPIYHS